MARRLRRWLALPAAERAGLWRAFAWLALMRLGLWLLPFRTMRRLLRGVAVAGSAAGAGKALAPERVAWAVDVASRYVPAATCLPRALATYTLLRRQGVPATVRIGVKKGAGGLEGHAWVEHEGRVLIGGTASPSHFQPLLSLARVNERDRGTILP